MAESTSVLPCGWHRPRHRLVRSRRAPRGLRLVASAGVTAAGASWPNGCHVCEVEIDLQTSAVEVRTTGIFNAASNRVFAAAGSPLNWAWRPARNTARKMLLLDGFSVRIELRVSPFSIYGVRV